MTARRAAATIAGLTILGALLRLPGLDSGLWFDEIVTLVDSVRPPLREIVTAFRGYNNHPFYSLLAHLSVAGFGEHSWTVRLPAVLFGIATIPLLYALAVTVTTRGEGIMAALLMTVSYHHVWFSQNARGYTALLMFTLVATLLLVKLLQRPNHRDAIAYGIAIALGLYTHLTMAFVAIAHALVWIWQVRQERDASVRRPLIRTACTALGVGAAVASLLYLPMAGQVYALLSAPPPPASARVATPRWAALETLRGLRVGFGSLGLLAALALVVLGGFNYLRRSPVALALFVLPGIISAAIMLLVGAAIRPRFFFSLLGFALLMLVRGAMESGRILINSVAPGGHRATVAGAVIVSVIAVVSAASLRYDYELPKQDYEGALTFIEGHRAVSESVVTAGLATYPYNQYYQRPWAAITRLDQLERVRISSPRVWMVYSFPEYMDTGLVKELQRSCNPEGIFRGTLGGGDVIVCTLTPRSG